ncbi:uncharacterized protein A4U43_C07F19130 [Asparagus officinalis]|uniref:Uncharacterized protein n=1 Tax=Asparagus officinalis TaxID=4686 RepID=A0A5P1ED41_ASPOF|nr:uncharacterized protein LOC109848678 isoform X2 [Asparagus officinalis]ONK63805.1 uncharacterized protein A4U43_C07F19130 [Asparagus officinalis]
MNHSPGITLCMEKILEAKSSLKMDTNGSTSLHPDIHSLQKEWDDISCPICMEHPHNAVLLICTSHEKGCRSYICDTSYRHSNCLDRFKKLNLDHSSDHRHSQSISSLHELPIPENFSIEIPERPRMRRITAEGTQGSLGAQVEESITVRDTTETNSLKCPLCRGTIIGYQVIKEARQYLDTRPRSCSRESCSFSGNYGELRRHARSVHPSTRPTDVDPSRQRAWHHLEHEREYGDILSAIRSAMPGSVMFGDYAINDEDVLTHDQELGSDGGPWLATLFLFHMMNRTFGVHDEFESFSRGLRRVRRRSSSLNRYLWGANLLGLQDDEHDDDEEIFMPRRRRRTTRSRESRPDDERSRDSRPDDERSRDSRPDDEML